VHKTKLNPCLYNRQKSIIGLAYNILLLTKKPLKGYAKPNPAE